MHKHTRAGGCKHTREEVGASEKKRKGEENTQCVPGTGAEGDNVEEPPPGEKPPATIGQAMKSMYWPGYKRAIARVHTKRTKHGYP